MLDRFRSPTPTHPPSRPPAFAQSPRDRWVLVIDDDSAILSLTHAALSIAARAPACLLLRLTLRLGSAFRCGGLRALGILLRFSSRWHGLPLPPAFSPGHLAALGPARLWGECRTLS